MEHRYEQHLEQHLYFLASHRGLRIDGDGYTGFASALPGYRFAFVKSAAALAAAANAFPLLCMPDCIPFDAGEHVVTEPVTTFAYMVKADELVACAPSGYALRRATMRQEILDFSHVQVAAFPGLAANYPPAYAIFANANLRNAVRDDHAYYVAYAGDAIAAITMTIRHAGLLGFYGVATLEEHRCRGLASALMALATADAARGGARQLSLQVEKNSAAHRLYRSLGFKDLFTVPVHTSKASTQDIPLRAAS